MASNLFLRVVGARTPHTPHDFVVHDKTYAFAFVLSIAAAVAAMLVVGEITRADRLRQQAAPATAWAGSAW